jgi:hypothetical protein
MAENSTVYTNVKNSGFNKSTNVSTTIQNGDFKNRLDTDGN